MTSNATMTLGDATKTPFVNIRLCGCWIVRLAQGPAVIVCAKHEDAVLKAIADA